jgi:hypothetical protein
MSLIESWTNRVMSYYVVQPCLSSCVVQAWSTSTVVDSKSEGHAGSYWWTKSDEGRALGLDCGTGVVGWLGLTPRTHTRARGCGRVGPLPETASLLSVSRTRQSLENTRRRLTLDKESSTNCTSATASLASTFYRALDKEKSLSQR